MPAVAAPDRPPHVADTAAANSPDDPSGRRSLRRFAWLGIGAALTTIALKTGAYLVTGSVGILSDAIESVVNLVGAVLALAMLTIAARPADEDHAYGHTKAEYFSSGVEGTLILIAALSIALAAAERLALASRPPGVGPRARDLRRRLAGEPGRGPGDLRASKRYQSVTLDADAHHLLTDVWTSAGVIAGVAAVAATGWQRLDPIIALVVAANIVWAGVRIVQRSVIGLMDTALPAREGPPSAARSNGAWKMACSLTRSGPASPVRGASFRCTCWSPASGRSTAAMNCWRASRRTSVRRCRT